MGAASSWHSTETAGGVGRAQAYVSLLLMVEGSAWALGQAVWMIE